MIMHVRDHLEEFSALKERDSSQTSVLTFVMVSHMYLEWMMAISLSLSLSLLSLEMVYVDQNSTVKARPTQIIEI
jgi:hypothetical protein